MKCGGLLGRLRNDSSPCNKSVSSLFNCTTDYIVRFQPTRQIFRKSKLNTLSHRILSHFNTLQIFCLCGCEIRLNIIPIYN